MSEPPADITEREVADALGGVAATAHALLGWVEGARPLIERLAEDYPPAAALLESLVVADARPPHPGTPRHLEQVAAEILRDLGS